ncbi:MAG: glycosyltransferase family 2 protein [Elusimicrobiota bacterium]
MPALNEQETVGICIDKAKKACDLIGLPYEIIVSDNGSSDRTVEIASGKGAIVVHQPVKGYGTAYMKGFEAASGEYIVMGDSDDSYDFSRIGPFIEKLQEGYDLVMGNRLGGTIEKGAMPWLNRYFGNPFLTKIMNFFLKTDISDVYCGMRGFRKDILEKINLRTAGMEFATEMVIKAAIYGLKTTEIPITLHKDGRTGSPHLRPITDGWRTLRFMLLYSPRWLLFYPGLTIMTLGIMIFIWLLPGPKTIGQVTFDFHTLLYGAIAVILGYQVISFALFARIFAITEGLLPDDPVLDNLYRFIKLESGLIAGIILFICGITGTVYALSTWYAVSFGPLVPSRTLRLAIPSVTLIILGVQTILASFFISILGLRRR